MIHSTALIDDRAQIDEDVSIEAYTLIGADVRIGKGTRIGPHVVIQGQTQIGRDNEIFQFCSIGELPQDKKYRNRAYQDADSKLVIGNSNTIREYCTINRGTGAGGGQTVVGDDNFFMAYVHIAHDCIVGSHNIFANASSLAGHVTIEDHVILSGFVLVHQFCRIGCHAYSGMGSGLARDLPPYLLAAGNPAQTHGLNKIGLRRSGFSTETIDALHRAYMDLVRTPTGFKEHAEKYRALGAEYPEIKHLIEFIESSQRGCLS